MTTTAPDPAAAAPRVRERDRAVSTYAELSRAVKERGLLDRRLGYYAVRISAAAAAAAALVAGVVVLGDSWWQLLPAAALGVLGTQFAFLGHDGAHRQVFASNARNDWAARVFAGLCAGLSHGWWMNKHTRHHAAPNQVGRDTDIESAVVAFHVEEAQKRRGLRAALTRHQGWFFLPLLLLSGANLHVDSVRSLARRSPVKGRWTDVGFIAAHWALYASVLLTTMGPGKAAAFVGVHLAVFGLCMGGAFAPNHVGMPIVERGARIDFLRRQVLTSRNIRGGVVVDFLMGGLNRQVEHHLFPSMPRPNLRRVQPLVREFCATHGIPYTETSLVGSYRAIISHLNEVGLRAGDPFSCPLAAQLRA
ncbi:acyl-CoA desaturase [Streptomyces sp. NP160]|uniref:fatty acid desaturase family protein n=1 Tax=Streptomyces sp. NP160 TaxID=2586637 RepID=UPI00111A8536|nr:acyl-CoA desaturase [Streptomyces sp. NP160]TNM69706.1 acyl-CoA desaturase [Streptomyces sp. NP160]